ncbi:hypothetical protein [Arsenophonus nasoniae]|uniref:hypothetical protein n=1 Tax=Arsenophonus nasoniae TaxID=638 RepID=UPI00387EE097
MAHLRCRTVFGLFELNRWLLGKLFPFAADNLLYAAKKRGLTMGILVRYIPMGEN